MSASTEWAANHGATNGKLHHQSGAGKTGAWSAKHNNLEQWLQVHFGKATKLRRVSTQGRMDTNQWVKTYKLSYSLDGIFYEYYKENGGVRVSFLDIDEV